MQARLVADQKIEDKNFTIILAIFTIIFAILIAATEPFLSAAWGAGKKPIQQGQNLKLVNNSPEETKKRSREMKQESTKYELPPLPYDYNELEPYYDQETLRLHHDKHHAAYVKELNLTEEKLAEARNTGDYALIRHLERTLAFNGSGHILHSIFWTNMAPNPEGRLRTPSGALADQITRDFGSFEAFKKQFSAAAISVEGSGWTILGWMPEFGKLLVLEVENHQNQTLWGIKPLLVVDVWEHAYYLRYQNRRAEWIENWWYLVNWDDVAKRFEQARR